MKKDAESYKKYSVCLHGCFDIPGRKEKKEGVIKHLFE